MPQSFFPPAPAAIPGLILPAINYVNTALANATLTFLRPPREVVPLTPDPVGADTVASDGTLWTTYLYKEAYLQFKQTIYQGSDLLNWNAFLDAAGNGQIMTFFPNSADESVSALVRLIVQGRQSSSTNSGNVPSGDPKPKRSSPLKYEAEIVLRLEDPTQCAAVYSKLIGLS